MAETSHPADRLLFLAPLNKKIHSCATDGSGLKTILDNVEDIPDGIDVDLAKGHIYFTRMGKPKGEMAPYNDGSIWRMNLDGSDVKAIIPKGGSHTPKQLELDLQNNRIYWCDREGMRVMRSNMDGSAIETLVTTGQVDKDMDDQRRWCVGIAVDHAKNHIYWTQKGTDNGNVGRIFRAGIDIPQGEKSENRSDIEVVFDKLPEPIDLYIDPDKRQLYWTDRGDPPRGNTVNRVDMDKIGQKDVMPDVLLGGLKEGIGLTIDFVHSQKMYITDLGGNVYKADLDGQNKEVLLSDLGGLTGIVFAKGKA